MDEKFLITRTQKVVCNGVLASQPQRVLSGVPQGTVLGPLLFLLCINVLPDKLQKMPRLFADDCIVYSSGSTTDHISSLQKDLKQLEHWQNMWQMSFNPSKCSILKISTKRNPPSKPITFCGEQLDETNSHPYLGVQLDSQMNWKEHMKNTTTKASRVLGMLQRNLCFFSKEVNATAYETLVRPTNIGIRKYCLRSAFTTTKERAQQRNNNVGETRLGQLGNRCKHNRLSLPNTK